MHQDLEPATVLVTCSYGSVHLLLCLKASKKKRKMINYVFQLFINNYWLLI